MRVGVGTDLSKEGARGGQGHPSLQLREACSRPGVLQAPSPGVVTRGASYPMAPLTYFPCKVSPPLPLTLPSSDLALWAAPPGAGCLLAPLL